MKHVSASDAGLIVQQELSEYAESALHTLMYFDVFRHPLTLDEIHRYCQWKACTLLETAAAIVELQSHSIIGNRDGFYCISGSEKHIDLRRERNNRALHYAVKAEKWARFISGFPFVRTVCISGSLSKGTMDKDGDVDYFIITEPGRLWVARTFLIFFKKLFLLNSKKYFCVNYFVDTAHLAIPDRNLFTATEIVFAKPMRDVNSFPAFIGENKWARIFYPNAETSAAEIPETRNGRFKRFLEKQLRGSFGEWLDDKFFRITLNRWKKKFPHLRESHFEVDFRSRKHVSKHHPQGFQRIVLTKLEVKRRELEEKHNIKIRSKVMEWLTDNAQ
jgi:hypothetical protein